MRRILFLALAFTVGCANSIAWKRIDDPGHYGTAYQRKDYAWALPCRNWCALVAGVPKVARQSFLVVRGGKDGLTCSCALPASSVQGSALMTMAERQSSPAFIDWIVTQMPAESVQSLSAEDMDRVKAAGMKIVADVEAGR